MRLTDRARLRAPHRSRRAGRRAIPTASSSVPTGGFYIGLLSAGRVVVTDSAGALVTKYDVPSTSAPNLTFSEDGKTMYVMAVDEPYEAPYTGKVFAIPLKE